MHLSYITTPLSDKVILDENESRHCIKVLRMKTGDRLMLADGKGCSYLASVVDDNYKKCTLEIISREQHEPERDYHLHIAIAPTKNMERFEWFIEKAVEIGIDEISPILCEHSERNNIRTDRLENIIVSAMKQSLKMYRPVLHELTPFETVVLSLTGSNNYIAHCGEGNKSLLKNTYQGKGKITILIGPEGDFSPSEISLAIENKLLPLSLGNTRLRTETAGVVACHSVYFMNL